MAEPGTNLRGNFNKTVCDGRNIYSSLLSTATGTGLGSGVSYKVGNCCLDRSAGDWFLCTVSASGGTWVKIVA